jgi:hypothetical protein
MGTERESESERERRVENVNALIEVNTGFIGAA